MKHVLQLCIDVLEERIAPQAVCLLPPGAAYAAEPAQVPDCIVLPRPECHPVGPDLTVCTL